jgi:hypothetical protein
MRAAGRVELRDLGRRVRRHGRIARASPPVRPFTVPLSAPDATVERENGDTPQLA